MALTIEMMNLVLSNKTDCNKTRLNAQTRMIQKNNLDLFCEST